jgi:hypothetical protein
MRLSRLLFFVGMAGLTILFTAQGTPNPKAPQTNDVGWWFCHGSVFADSHTHPVLAVNRYSAITHVFKAGPGDNERDSAGHPSGHTYAKQFGAWIMDRYSGRFDPPGFLEGAGCRFSQTEAEANHELKLTTDTPPNYRERLEWVDWVPGQTK